MSKTLNITITNLTINVTAGQRRPAMSDLLESLFANLHIVPADENGKTDDAPAGDTASTEAAPAAQTVDTLKGDLVAFLQPTDKFSLRTLAAIQKAFPGRTLSDLHIALHELVEDNVIATKRRRADGETLYEAIAQAYVDVPAQPEAAADTTNVTTGEAPAAAEASAPVIPPTVDAIVEFLEGGDYELRTLAAIRKNFAEHNHNDIAAVLQIAVGSGKVYTRRRRFDGATLYGAA
jgi:hypothetical protein